MDGKVEYDYKGGCIDENLGRGSSSQDDYPERETDDEGHGCADCTVGEIQRGRKSGLRIRRHASSRQSQEMSIIR